MTVGTDILPPQIGHGLDQASRLREMVEAMARTTTPDADPVPRRPVTPSPSFRRAPIIAITSGKGGVGKTTLSVNLAIALAARSFRVTLVDADLGMANADVLCGINPARRLDRLLADPDRSVDSIAVDAPGGFRLIPGAAGIAHIAGLDHHRYVQLLQRLTELGASSDAILIDTGAGVGPGVTAFCEGADLTVVVVTPEPTSIADAYAMIKCLALTSGARIPSLLINQATSPEEAHAVSDRIANVAGRFLGTRPPMLAWIPADPSAPRCVRQRTPLLVGQPHSPAAVAISHAAAALADLVSLNRPKPPKSPRIVRAVAGLLGLRSGAPFADRRTGVV